MALADTARLVASLELQDKFTKTAQAADKSLGGLETRVGTTSKTFGGLSGTLNKAGSQFAAFGTKAASGIGQLGNVVTRSLATAKTALSSVGSQLADAFGGTRIGGVIKSFGTRLSGVFTPFADAARRTLGPVRDAFSRAFGTIGQAASGLGGRIRTGLGSVFGAISSTASRLGGTVARSLGAGFSGAVGLLGRAGSAIRSGFNVATSAVGRFGDALGHAKGRLVGLLSGPLGLLGLGAGALSIGGLFKSGVDEVKEFAGEVSRISKVTGLSVEQASRLAGAFHHFGIEADTVAKIVGIAEKNLGALGIASKSTSASADKLAKAHERVALATLKLREVEAKGNATTSQRLAAQQRLADAQRNLAKLLHSSSAASSKAAEFQKQYGLRILDSSGRIKNFNDLLLASADFFNNKSIPAQTKAVALSKIYGKSWQDLIPILSAGRKGISDAEDEAQKLGLTLTKDNLNQLKELKEATRGWTTSLGGLKLQIGLVAIPLLTTLFKSATTFISGNRERIIGFFQKLGDAAKTVGTIVINTLGPALSSAMDIMSTIGSGTTGLSFMGILKDSASFAKDLGAILRGTVVPAVQAVTSAWEGLPAQVRQLLIEGFLANKIVKWTFGFDAIGFGKQLASSFLGGVVGKLAAAVGGEGIVGALEKVGIGKAFVQPVFVTNPGFGPGGPNIPTPDSPTTGTKPGGSALSKVLNIVQKVAIVSIAAEAAQALSPEINQAGADIHDSLFGKGSGFLGTGIHIPSPNEMEWPFGNKRPAWLPTDIASSPLGDLFGIKPGKGGVTGGSFADTGASAADDRRSEGALSRMAQALPQRVASKIGELSREFISALRTATTRRDPFAAHRAAADAAAGAGNLRNTQRLLAVLQQLRAAAVKRGDKQTVKLLDGDIAKIGRVSQSREGNAKFLAKVDKVVRSNESNGQKLKDLKALEKEYGGKNKHVLDTIHSAIEQLKPHLNRVKGATDRVNTNVRTFGAHTQRSVDRLDTTTHRTGATTVRTIQQGAKGTYHRLDTVNTTTRTGLTRVKGSTDRVDRTTHQVVTGTHQVRTSVNTTGGRTQRSVDRVNTTSRSGLANTTTAARNAGTKTSEAIRRKKLAVTVSTVVPVTNLVNVNGERVTTNVRAGTTRTSRSFEDTHASGGIARSRRPALVGEFGPEVITPTENLDVSPTDVFRGLLKLPTQLRTSFARFEGIMVDAVKRQAQTMEDVSRMRVRQRATNLRLDLRNNVTATVTHRSVVRADRTARSYSRSYAT